MEERPGSKAMAAGPLASAADLGWWSPAPAVGWWPRHLTCMGCFESGPLASPLAESTAEGNGTLARPQAKTQPHHSCQREGPASSRPRLMPSRPT